jgi:hypothetical protein
MLSGPAMHVALNRGTAGMIDWDQHHAGVAAIVPRGLPDYGRLAEPRPAGPWFSPELAPIHARIDRSSSFNRDTRLPLPDQTWQRANRSACSGRRWTPRS